MLNVRAVSPLPTFSERFHHIRRTGGDGWDWLNGLLYLESITASQQARLLECTRDHPRAWKEAETLGPDVLSNYWKLMNYAGLGNDFAYVDEVTRGLLSVGRAADAVRLLGIYKSDASLATDRRAELAVEALEALAHSSQPLELDEISVWPVTQLLDFLAEHYELTEDNLDDPMLHRLTRLEIIYLGLRSFDEAAPFIHRRMAIDPHAFVEIVCVFHPRNDNAENDDDLHSRATPEQRHAAFRILRTWQSPPGIDSLGIVDPERLRAWIDRAQHLLDEVDRRKVGDGRIGQVLSALPPDPTDGIAPPVAVRQLLEEGQTTEFENGLGSGLHMGPTLMGGGMVSEMLAESRLAREKAICNAQELSARWPSAARLLIRVAEAHEASAREWKNTLDRPDRSTEVDRVPSERL